MSLELSSTFLQHFESLEDPRMETHRNKRHLLEDILIITILGCICGADTWTDLCEFAECKLEWLETFLSLPNGIPSHDTFNRVLSSLDPEEFNNCFFEWIRTLSIDTENEIIAIDGKTVRGSRDSRNKRKPIHLVSAWAVETGIMLGQQKTAMKSNEIEAIPRLLDLIDVKGSTVTIDAMGCQTKIAKKILHNKADYVLSLKENQKSLYDSVKLLFALAEADKKKQYKDMLHLRRIEKLRGHGRIETRKYTLVSARDAQSLQVRWPGLKGIGKVDIKRVTGNEVEHSTRYFLTSLEYNDIEQFMRAVRKHWNIEINLHWSLDVSFNEDFNRNRKGHSAENLALIRRVALNLLKQENSKKIGISAKRKKSGWSNQYLLKVLTADQKLIERA